MSEVTTKVTTGKVRFSYCHLWSPSAVGEGDDPKYSVAIIIPKEDTASIKKIKAAIEAAKQLGIPNKWGGKLPPASKLKTPLRDGDEEKPDDHNYEDSYFINCSSKQKPGIVDENVEEILDQSQVYSGCYGRVSINFYPFNAQGNKGIAAGLNNVQKLEDGDALAGGSTAEDDFGGDNLYDDML